MRVGYNVFFTLLLAIISSVSSGQVKGTELPDAGTIGAAAKTAAVTESMNDSTKSTDPNTAKEETKKNAKADNELKKRYVFAGAGFVTIVIIAFSVKRRKASAKNKA